MAAAPTPPIYHERQQLSRCAVHAVNNLLGGPVYSARVRAAGERAGGAEGGRGGRSRRRRGGGIRAVELEAPGVPGRGGARLGGLASRHRFLSPVSDAAQLGKPTHSLRFLLCVCLFLLRCTIAVPVCSHPHPFSFPCAGCAGTPLCRFPFPRLHPGPAAPDAHRTLTRYVRSSTRPAGPTRIGTSRYRRCTPGTVGVDGDGRRAGFGGCHWRLVCCRPFWGVAVCAAAAPCTSGGVQWWPTRLEKPRPNVLSSTARSPPVFPPLSSVVLCRP